MFEKYERLTNGCLSAYICELSLKGYSDYDIAVALGVRWLYLFNMSFEQWFDIISEYRELQLKGKV